MALKRKVRRILASPRIVIVMLAVLLSIYSTGIPLSLWREGVVVQSVEKGSVADDAGMRASESGSMEVIVEVGGRRIKSISGYASAVSGAGPNETVIVETDRTFYRLTTMNSTDAGDLGIRVANAPKTNLKLGLDLQGGARVMLKPDVRLSVDDIDLVISNMNKRLNLFGLSDVVVRDAADLSGNQFIMVEVAGANENDVRQLIARQGKFEAKISNETVFTGNEISDVCRSATCSGIDFQTGAGCSGSSSDWFCRFYFTISLSEEAAAKQAEATSRLAVVDDYLSEPLQLYLDDELVDELQIGKELKGNRVTSVRISGSGSGASKADASKDAISNMKRLQSILITGYLPVKLEVVRTDSISPILGEQFLRNALKVGLIAILFVVGVLAFYYRKLQIAIPVMLTSLLEIFIMLGIASLLPFLNWTIDLAAIAGIIAAVGTGVNDQIIITDEALKGEQRRIFSWKEKLKSAFSVIFGAYLTLLVAMLPLFAVGAGMLKGFALTTIIGMTVGVFITRPAYSKVIELLSEKD